MLQCIILEKKKPFCLQEHSFDQFIYLSGKVLQNTN